MDEMFAKLFERDFQNHTPRFNNASISTTTALSNEILGSQKRPDPNNMCFQSLETKFQLTSFEKQTNIGINHNIYSYILSEM